MILTAHILAGAAASSATDNYWLAGALGFLSHFALDFLPHNGEYSIDGLKQRKFNRRFLSDGLKVALDLVIGFSLVLYFIFSSHRKNIVLVGAIFGILPDLFSFLYYLFPLYYSPVDYLHKKVHFLENKKINPFIKIFSQAAVSALALWILKQ